MSSFDEDVYARETEAMDTALLRGLHQPMKKWFSTAEAKPLRDAVGDFPSFWQDMGGWEHLRVTKKVYMAVSDLREAGDTDSIDVASMVAKALGTGAASSNGAEVEEGQEATQERKRRRKKKSRWGVEADVDASASASAGAGAQARAPASASEQPSSSVPGASEAGPADAAARSGVDAGAGLVGLAAATDRGRDRSRASLLWSSKDAIAETFKDEARKGGLLGNPHPCPHPNPNPHSMP